MAKHKFGLKTRWEFVFVVQQYWYGWRRQIKPLAQAGFRLLIPDQRGYNLSDKPKGVKAYRLEELSWDIIGLLDNLGKQTCCLVGHDWGAAVAWNVAMASPTG